MRILVTAGRSPGALDLIRRLAKFHHKVFVVDSALINLAQFSQYIEKNYRVSPPRQQLDLYLLELNKIIEQEKIELIIPTYEEAYFISKIKDQLDAPVYISEIGLLKTLHNKYEFVQLQKSLGVKVPLSNLVTKPDEVLNVLNQHEQDFVLKPIFSRYGEQVLVGREKIKQQIHKIKLSKEEQWVLQEKIKGVEYCTYSLCFDGKVTSTVIYPKDINDWNVSICFNRVQNLQIEKWIEYVIAKTNYHGQIGFDLFLTEQNEILACECNPRMTSGIHLVNPKYDIVSLIQGRELEQYCDQNRWLGAIGVVEALKKGSLLTDLCKYQDVLFDSRDMAPYLLGQHISFFYQILLSKKLNKSITQATTHDIEWNGE